MKKKLVYLIYYRVDITNSIMLYQTKYHYDSYIECLCKVNELNSSFTNLVFYCKPVEISKVLGDIIYD